MTSVKFENKVIEFTNVYGETRWCPMIKLGNGAYNFISQQGNILQYGTKEEAEAYFED